MVVEKKVVKVKKGRMPAKLLYLDVLDLFVFSTNAF